MGDWLIGDFPTSVLEIVAQRTLAPSLVRIIVEYCNQDLASDVVSVVRPNVSPSHPNPSSNVVQTAPIDNVLGDMSWCFSHRPWLR